MEKDKEIKTVENKEVDIPKESVKWDDKIVDIFKIMLGYNWHTMGTKKDF